VGILYILTPEFAPGPLLPHRMLAMLNAAVPGRRLAAGCRVAKRSWLV